MRRGTLLKALPAAGLLSTASFGRAQEPSGGDWKTYETVTRPEIAAASRAWVPLPPSQDTDWVQTLESSISGNLDKSRIVVEPVYRAAMVVAISSRASPSQ